MEQSNFVYAEAAAAWREVFETNFDILNDSRLIDVASAEYALGKTGEASDEQTAAPLLLAMHDLGSKAFERADVYREFFAPTPLGGESISNFDVPTINSLKDAVFEKWKDENKVAAACKRGSTRNEGKVVIRATGRLGEVDPPRYVMGILRCMYGRLHVVDASGAVELCIESFLKTSARAEHVEQTRRAQGVRNHVRRRVRRFSRRRVEPSQRFGARESMRGLG